MPLPDSFWEEDPIDLIEEFVGKIKEMHLGINPCGEIPLKPMLHSGMVYILGESKLVGQIPARTELRTLPKIG